MTLSVLLTLETFLNALTAPFSYIDQNHFFVASELVQGKKKKKKKTIE
jgi:hypothetical protein